MQNEKEIDFIDSIPAYKERYRMLSNNEDVFITYDHEAFGQELFCINYSKGENVTFLSEENIKIIPNPASTDIKVHLDLREGLYSISVLDNAGKTIIDNHPTTELDVSMLNNGVYFVQVNYKNGTSIRQKMIKQ